MVYAQIFRYTLALTSDEYQSQFVDPYAESLASIDGLISKTWMADFDKKQFASFYLWRDKDAMDRFMESEAVAHIAQKPFFRDLSIVSMPVQEPASRITRGLTGTPEDQS